MGQAKLEPEALLALWRGLGTGLGLLLALAIFSLLVRDNRFARLAQHIFVGASLGYLGVIALADVLQPRVASGLEAGLSAPDQWVNLWLPLALGGLLLAATVERMLAEPPGELAAWRRLLRGAGALPAVLLVSIGIAAGVMGVLQGTLWPQFLEAARRAIPADSATLLQNGGGGAFASGLLTLLASVATLLFWTARPLANQRLLRGVIWIGQRAFWLAAGAIFARLAAARFDLLIAQAESLWRWLGGAGL